MIGFFAQKGLGMFSRGTRTPKPGGLSGASGAVTSECARLIEMLDIMVAQCEREAELVDDDGLMPDRYYALVRATEQGHYRIEPERIAERLMRH